MSKPFGQGSSHLRASPLEIVPIGGLGEFGMNMMAIGCGDDIVVIDAGLMFPSHHSPGVDLLLPDLGYLREHRDKIRGIVLTHGHEDHIGALSHLLRNMPLPVYGTRLTLGLVQRRLEENGLLDDAELEVIAPGDTFRLGKFILEPVHVSHSLADAVAIAIHTPRGLVVHTGDFKIDENPPVGPPIDLGRFAELGKEGVVCLLSDSTNAERPGRTREERSVEDAFDSILADAPGRVLLSCFTSSTHRIQIAFDLAQKHGRKVALVGRSMVENIRVAIDLGYLKPAPGVLWELEDFHSVPRGVQLVLTAGSQGEPMSALSQIASGNHRLIRLEPNDRVILSARVIPGNERAVNRILNNLFRRGVEVFYPPSDSVHVSGHGSAEDLDMLLRLVQPKHFVPIHGEHRQLFHHAKIARNAGLDPNDVIVAESGDVLRIDDTGASIVEHLEMEHALLDASGLGLVEDCIVRDRRQLAATGVVVPMVAMSPRSDPEVSDILSRGFVENEASEELLAEAHDAMLEALRSLSKEERESEGAVESALEASLKRFFRKKAVRRPVIVPIVVGSIDS
jgi:ribonuclease J